MDISANRQAAKYSTREKLLRILWALATPLFRFSPRPFFGWRRFLLRLFGAKIGQGVNVYSSAIITMPWNLEIQEWASVGERALIYNLGPISIGAGATISQQAHLCAGTHDYSDLALPLQKMPIVIGAQAWVCADAFVGPGITVGDGAIVGARAVTTKDVPPWQIVAGNPARFVKERKLREGNKNE